MLYLHALKAVAKIALNAKPDIKYPRHSIGNVSKGGYAVNLGGCQCGGSRGLRVHEGGDVVGARPRIGSDC